MRLMRGTIKEKAKFDIDEVNPIEYIDKVRIPCVFVTGDSDYVVKYDQFQALYKKFQNKKRMFVVKGNHSDPRITDQKFAMESMEFFKANLLEGAVSTNVSNNGRSLRLKRLDSKGMEISNSSFSQCDDILTTEDRGGDSQPIFVDDMSLRSENPSNPGVRG